MTQSGKLTAEFRGLQGRGYACALLIRPGNPNVEGGKLEALGRAAAENFRRVVVFLDDVTGGDAPEESRKLAQEWLERNRERLEDCGISLERMTRWSEFPVRSYFEAELRKLCDGNRNLRQVMHSFAVDAADQDVPDFRSVSGALPKVFQRMAGYIVMKGLCQMPVVGTNDVPADSRLFEKAGNGDVVPGLLILPETYFITFRETPPAPPEQEQPTMAKVVQLFPRRS